MNISVENLVVRFPGNRPPALDAVTLRLDEGQQAALLGPSGSGKTTLLRALLGGVKPTSGRVTIGGYDPLNRLGDAQALRRMTGVVRQGSDLILALSARCNALAGTAATWSLRDWLALLRKRVPAPWAERFAALCRDHGIDHLLDVPAAHLSGGERQRVALVRALLPAPRLLLADEPTSGLDPATAAAAVQALRSAGATLLLATHDLAVARQFPRVIALRAGRVVYDGPGFDATAAAAVYGLPREAGRSTDDNP